MRVANSMFSINRFHISKLYTYEGPSRPLSDLFAYGPMSACGGWAMSKLHT